MHETMRFPFQILVVYLVFHLVQGQNPFDHSPYRMSYLNAVNYCKGRFMNLVKIEDATKNTAVFQYAMNNNLGQYWINANDNQMEGFWVDSDNNVLKYNNWHPVEPQGNRKENCVHGLYYPDALWNDVSCDCYMSVICEKMIERIDKFGRKIPNPIPPTVRRDHKHGPNKMNFIDAVRYCESQKLELIIIDKPISNVAAFEYARNNSLDTYWVNVNDDVQESVWVDSSRRRVSFLNFHLIEPDGGSYENCVISGYFKYEAWADVTCDTQHWAICQPVSEPDPFTFSINKSK